VFYFFPQLLHTKSAYATFRESSCRFSCRIMGQSMKQTRNLKDSTVRKRSPFRCKWLEDIVSSTCEPPGLACQVSLEKLNRIVILNINSISTGKKERKEAVSIQIIWPCLHVAGKVCRYFPQMMELKQCHPVRFRCSPL
jgi:hypothetical protein